ncbi:MAG: hypothetical protein II942_02915 [Alphaproteobacteria bacterium]|nr:hypothetical protein [Alphaproteobacteria bacterium]
MRQTDESGRSILEMLLILVIMAVLSAVAIIGYSLAVNEHRANETTNRLMKRVIIVSQQLLVDQPPNLGGFDENDGFYKIQNHVDTDTPGKFKLTVENVPERVCKKIIEMDWQVFVEKPADCSGIANRTFTFTNNLKEEPQIDPYDIEYDLTNDDLEKDCIGSGYVCNKEQGQAIFVCHDGKWASACDLDDQHCTCIDGCSDMKMHASIEDTCIGSIFN